MPKKVIILSASLRQNGNSHALAESFAKGARDAGNEAEVVSLIAENAETGDIIHALNKSVAKKTAAMAQRMGGGAPYLMTGGVARNAGVVGELTAGVGAPVVVAEHPDLAGAVGAALYAMS